MNKREIVSMLAMSIIERDRGITIIDSETSLEQAKQKLLSEPEPILIKNYGIPDLVYNPNHSNKRGSKFTPKKKKRKKH